jgi:hypothetical protein
MEAEIRRMKVPGLISRHHLNRKYWVWWQAPAVHATAESINKRILVQAC